jgi:hypothetical protein
MSLEDKFAQHDKVIVDKYATPRADYAMRTYDYVLRPEAFPATGAFTIYLPPVSLAKGRFYSIIARRCDAVNTITIADLDDSECWPGDITLNGKCDRALLYSDGLSWHVLSVLTFSDTAAPTTFETSAAPTTARGTTLAPTTSQT